MASTRRTPRTRSLPRSQRRDLIVVAPSNPFLSVAPILSVPGMRDALLRPRAPDRRHQPDRRRRGRARAGGADHALAGRRAERRRRRAPLRRTWPGLLDVLVIDDVDAADAGAMRPTGIRAARDRTLIGAEKERRRLAQEILELAGAL